VPPDRTEPSADETAVTCEERGQRLHPPLEPYSQGQMDTGEGHSIYFEQCGNPRGLPVVVLHGGPASGCSPMQRRFFDPAIFRIVLFDQRGCGRSRPRGSVANNDTAALVRDIEQLRSQLGVERWMVFGGSWGASLAIAYAADHLSSCSGLVLRGSFLTGNRDLDWFFGGAGTLLPVAWRKLVSRIGLEAGLSECELAGHAVLAMLKRLLESDDLAVAGAAAAAWAQWEDSVSRPGVGAPTADTEAAQEPAPAVNAADAAAQSLPPSSRDLVDKYRIQAHYLASQCFLGEERLLAMARRLRALPVEMVHGRLDWVCRPANAWQVHEAMPASRLTWVDHGGHNPYEPPMLAALTQSIRRIQDRSGSA
jgi:proline iminopeptidase